MDDTDILLYQVRIHIQAGYLVENNRRTRTRRRNHTFGHHDSLFRRNNGQLSVLAAVINPQTIGRARRLIQRIGQSVRRTGIDSHRLRGKRIGIRIERTDLLQPALAPAHDHSLGAVPQRIHRHKSPAGRNLIVGADVVDRYFFLRRPDHCATVRDRRLFVLYKIRDIDRRDITAEVGVVKWPYQHHHPAVWHLTRLGKLNNAAIDAGVMTVCAIQQFEVTAIGVHFEKMNAVNTGSVIPAREHHLTIRQHRWIAVMALVERHLLDIAAVRSHYMEDECGLIAVLILRLELRLALVEKHRL